ncbi:MAG TPA: acyltransferase [Solirubrobacterales bacterium]
MSPAGAPHDETWGVRRRFFPAVEGMRGVAALLVLFSHVLFIDYGAEGTRGILGIWMGSFGVTIFFAISGFLLYRPFLAARHQGKTVREMVPTYFLRRSVRIFPAYWVALTLTAFSFFAALSGVFTHDWWVYYGLLQIYWPAKQLLGLPVAWTLCIEASFYLVLPLIALALYKVGAGSRARHALLWEFGALGALAAASIAFNVIVTSDPSTVWLINTLGGLMIWFVGGMVLAALQVVHPASLRLVRRVLARPEICWPAGIALYAMNPLGTFDELPLWLHEIIGPLDVTIAALLLMGPATLGDGGRLVRWSLTNRTMVYAGTISYGIYLYHLPIALWLKAHWPQVVDHHPTWTLGSLTVLGAVIFGSLSWYLIEKPLMGQVRSVKASFDSRKGGRAAAQAAQREAAEPAP